MVKLMTVEALIASVPDENKEDQLHMDMWLSEK